MTRSGSTLEDLSGVPFRSRIETLGGLVSSSLRCENELMIPRTDSWNRTGICHINDWVGFSPSWLLMKVWDNRFKVACSTEL